MSENKRLRIDFNGLLWRLLQAAPVDHWPTMASPFCWLS